MKSIFKPMLTVAFALTLFSCSQPDIHKMRTITVSGTGKVYVTPDKATVNLAVITRNDDINAAQEENAATMTSVLASVSALGIANEDIQTYDYGIEQETRWKDGDVIYGKYKVTNRIKVSVADIEKASEIISAAVKSGATGVDSLSFSYEDEAKAVKRARELAIENAKAIAEESTATAGARLGKVLVMEERQGGRPSYMSQIASNSLTQSWEGGVPVYSDMAGGAPPLSTGKKEISVIVDMMFELK